MKPHKQTSPAISSIAAKYVRMTNAKFMELVLSAGGKDGSSLSETFVYSDEAAKFFRDIRKLAASALAQDEQKGQDK